MQASAEAFVTHTHRALGEGVLACESRTLLQLVHGLLL